jgi:uncharacterized membrane protein YfbV (UPF0208 family)
MDELKIIKKFAIWVSILMLIISSIVWFANKSTRVIDTAIIHYEEFQEIYNTCQKLNTDLAIIQETPETDKQFEQFTKSQRINSIKQNLNRWVEDYNAKSKMWNRALWKSSSLPYQLDVNQFSNYKN